MTMKIIAMTLVLGLLASSQVSAERILTHHDGFGNVVGKTFIDRGVGRGVGVPTLGVPSMPLGTIFNR